MKLISPQEYDELMAFLEPIFKSLWDNENKQRSKDDQLEMFQFGFPISDIYYYSVEDQTGFFLIFNPSFLRLIYDQIIAASQQYPERFGTGDANDVLSALFEVSGYHGSIKDYQRFLQEFPCCYIVYKKNGFYDAGILKIETYSILKPAPDNPDKKEFVGGLLHTLRHFSVDDTVLSTTEYKNNVFDLHHLMYLIAMSFRLKQGEGIHYKATQELGEDLMIASFYKEETTGVFYLNSYYKKCR